MKVSGRSLKSFPLNNERKGILQYYRGSNLLNFNATDGGIGASSVLDASSYWKTSNKSDSYFSVSLKNMRIHLTHVALLSCYSVDCINNLKIKGSIGNGQWFDVCKYEGGYKTFYNQTGSFSCKNTRAYESFNLKDL